MPGAIAMINVVGNLARGRPPRRPRPPLGDGGRHQDGCPAAARARAAVKPFECCRPHRFRPGTKASNTPNLEATTGQTPKELQSGFEFTGEEIDARDIAARPREGRDQTAPDRDPRRVPKTIRWASMPAASSRGRSAPNSFFNSRRVQAAIGIMQLKREGSRRRACAYIRPSCHANPIS